MLGEALFIFLIHLGQMILEPVFQKIDDVPIKIDFPQMEGWKIDSPEVFELFENFGFKTLTDRVKKVGKQVDESKQSTLF